MLNNTWELVLFKKDLKRSLGRCLCRHRIGPIWTYRGHRKVRWRSCFMFAKNPLLDLSGAPRGRHRSDRCDCSCCVGSLNAFIRCVRCCTRVCTKLFYQRGFHGRLVALCSPNQSGGYCRVEIADQRGDEQSFLKFKRAPSNRNKCEIITIGLAKTIPIYLYSQAPYKDPN